MLTDKDKLTFGSSGMGHTAPRGAQFGLRSLMLVTAGACVLFAVLKAAGATLLQAGVGLIAIGLFCVVLVAMIEIITLLRRSGDWQGRDPHYGGRPSMWAQWSGRYAEHEESRRRPTPIDFSAVPDENIEWLGEVHHAADSRAGDAVPSTRDTAGGPGIDRAEENGDDRRKQTVPIESFGSALRDDRPTP